METTLVFAVLIIAIALIFDLTNGWHDAAVPVQPEMERERFPLV